MTGKVSKILMVGVVLFHLSQAIELKIVTRQEWNARHPTENVSITLPIQNAIILDTNLSVCTDKNSCIRQVLGFQSFHMDWHDLSDISYNFLIGGDGLVYEGRGWGIRGAFGQGYNSNSTIIAFIGSFKSTKPTREQQQVAQLLLEEGLLLKYLSSDYKLYGCRQLRPEESPGDSLFEIIKNWPHWSEV